MYFAAVEINPIWPRSDLDKVVIAEKPVASVSDILLILITLSQDKRKLRVIVKRRTNTNCTALSLAPCLCLTLLSIRFSPGRKVSGPVYKCTVRCQLLIPEPRRRRSETRVAEQTVNCIIRHLAHFIFFSYNQFLDSASHVSIFAPFSSSACVCSMSITCPCLQTRVRVIHHDLLLPPLQRSQQLRNFNPESNLISFSLSTTSLKSSRILMAAFFS